MQGIVEAEAVICQLDQAKLNDLAHHRVRRQIESHTVDGHLPGVIVMLAPIGKCRMQVEPPRETRRLQTLRRWSHEEQ